MYPDVSLNISSARNPSYKTTQVHSHASESFQTEPVPTANHASQSHRLQQVAVRPLLGGAPAAALTVALSKTLMEPGSATLLPQGLLRSSCSGGVPLPKDY